MSAKRNMVYQIGTIHSLLSGVYEGDMNFKELSHYGDFGLGTFDAVNGEMIALDGEFYRIDADLKAHRVEEHMKTPFAVVTHFKNYKKHEFDSYEDLQALQKYIGSTFESQNIIYAIRIEGEFSEVDIRSEHPQPSGHKPLSQTMPKVQTTSILHDTEGTMAGFWFPKHLKTINVPGFHFHFLDKEHKLGGHVFDAKVLKATIKIVPIFDFGMHLIHTKLFEDMNIQTDETSMTSVEKDK